MGAHPAATRRGGACRRSRRWPTGQPDRAARAGRGHAGRDVLRRAALGRRRAPERGPDRRRHLHLRAVGPVDQGARVRQPHDGAPGRAPRARAVHVTHRDPGRLHRPPARRLPHGRDARAGRHERPRRGLRPRGPVLHRRLDHPDLAGRQPVADDRRGQRALRRRARRPGGRPRAARRPGPPQAARRDRRREGSSRMTRLVLTAALALALAVPAAAGASQPPTGWDGTNPYRCTLQNAGFQPTGPDPAADPYCVDFDKRHQSVADGGVVAFLSLEPARVAAATDKCFYFQSDHWRGSVVQEDGSTKTYEWDGHYFFDKARGEGGVWVTNFNVNGQTGDPSQVPGVPPDIAEHFGNGTGGVITRDNFEADPTCAERAKKEGGKIYASGRAGASGGTPAGGCVRSGAVTP